MEKQDFNAVMNEVAAALTMVWENIPERWEMGGHLKGIQDEKIFVRFYQDRFEISPSYPRDNRGYCHNNFPPVKITVSANKNANQIARDIERRFLPVYRANLEYVKERIAKSNAYEARKHENIESIAAHFGCEIVSQDHTMGIYPRDCDAIHCLEMVDDENVKFKIECTADMAIQVIELLMKNQ